MNIPLLILIITAASFVQSAAGYGFSMVALSLMTFFLPMRTGSVIAVLAMLPLTLYITLRHARKVNWRIFLIPFITSSIATLLGVRLLLVADNTLLLKILGGVLVLLSLFTIFAGSNLRITPTIPVQLSFGVVSGILSGLFTMGGPPIAIYMLAATADKDEYNSTLQTFFLFATVVAILTHLFYGNITREALVYSAYALIGVAVGTALGLAFLKRLSNDKVRKLVYGVMLVMGVVLLLK